MTLRKNWIKLQLEEAQKSFEESPASLYHNTPLMEIKAAADSNKRKKHSVIFSEDEEIEVDID